MFVSAFQSYLFNSALSQRFDDGHTLTEPLVGDHLIFANGRTDSVTATNSTAVSLHIRRGRCTIALFMPGKDPFEIKSDGDLTIAALLEKYAITAEDFRKASAFVHTKFDGAWRPIALKTNIDVSLEKNDVRLKFSLPPGHYATTVCREFMKADPVQMI
jgi:tRNA pseudouridine13 synthase